jgi:hypothetical protein
MPRAADADATREAAQAYALLLQHHWTFARKCKKLSAPAIRLFLARKRPTLPKKQRSPAVQQELRSYDAATMLLWTAVPDSLDDKALVVAWKEAVVTVADLDTFYKWGSPKRRAKVQRIVDDPRLVAGAAAAAVACEHVPLNLLAALAIDGSEASLDALVPQLSRAETVRDDMLDRLAQISKFPKNHPVAKMLLSRTGAQVAARQASSPAWALARSMGFDEKGVFFWTVAVDAVPPAGGTGVPPATAVVGVDSRDARWLSVYVSWLHGGITDFDDAEVAIDELKVGRCAAEELPAWLVRVARKLRVTWDWSGTRIKTSVRGGAKREQIRSWIRGATR